MKIRYLQFSGDINVLKALSTRWPEPLHSNFFDLLEPLKSLWNLWFFHRLFNVILWRRPIFGLTFLFWSRPLLSRFLFDFFLLRSIPLQSLQLTQVVVQSSFQLQNLQVLIFLGVFIVNYLCFIFLVGRFKIKMQMTTVGEGIQFVNDLGLIRKERVFKDQFILKCWIIKFQI